MEKAWLNLDVNCKNHLGSAINLRAVGAIAIVVLSGISSSIWKRGWACKIICTAKFKKILSHKSIIYKRFVLIHELAKKILDKLVENDGPKILLEPLNKYKAKEGTLVATESNSQKTMDYTYGKSTSFL